MLDESSKELDYRETNTSTFHASVERREFKSRLWMWKGNPVDTSEEKIYFYATLDRKLWNDSKAAMKN